MSGGAIGTGICWVTSSRILAEAAKVVASNSRQTIE